MNKIDNRYDRNRVEIGEKKGTVKSDQKHEIVIRSPRMLSFQSSNEIDNHCSNQIGFTTH